MKLPIFTVDPTSLDISLSTDCREYHENQNQDIIFYLNLQTTHSGLIQINTNLNLNFSICMSETMFCYVCALVLTENQLLKELALQNQ